MEANEHLNGVTDVIYFNVRSKTVEDTVYS